MAKAAQKGTKPDIVDKKFEAVKYTPEELESIQDFLSFFNRVPGQIEVPPELGGTPFEEKDASVETEFPIPEKQPEETLTLDGPALEIPAPQVPVDDLGELPPPLPTDVMMDQVGELRYPETTVMETPDPKEGSSIPSLEELSPSSTFTTEPTPPPSPPQVEQFDTATPEGETKFDDDQIQTLHKKLKNYPLPIRRLVMNSIIKDKLSPDDVLDIVKKINKEAPVDEIKKFLELKLGVDLGYIQKDKEDKVRVVVSRPDYTTEGLEERRKRLRRLQIGGLSIILLFTVGIFFYQFIIRPWLYRSWIDEGKEIILKNAPDPPSLAGMKQAEKLFDKASSYYPGRIEGYLRYANAYSKVRFYGNAFEKLFGRVSLVTPFRLKNEYISVSDQFWGKIKKVPTVSYLSGEKNRLRIDNSPWNLEKKGAYLIAHLDKKESNSAVLLALGKFHSNPVKRFRRSPYRNNLLGIGYFKRILTFETTFPLLEKENYQSKALQGIGSVYYHQKDYFKSNEYFEKIITHQPDNALGHAGILRNLLSLYKDQRDPRLIIDYHNKIKYSIDIEHDLPLDVLAKLAAFYIDLPEGDDLRIEYNISPRDSINAQVLKKRSFELLNILYSNEEIDEYENVKKGKYLAEGFYQRGRYYYKVMKQPRAAMKQFEYAYKYDPRHFMALNDRAEILLDIHDYNGAIENLDMAIQQLSPERFESLGDHLEDETLLQADIGKIYFNYGCAIYLSTVEKMGETNEWQRMKESERYKTESDFGLEPLVSALDKADVYFSKGDEIGLKDEDQRTKLIYYQGWSSYIRGNPKKALFLWESIPPEWQLRYRNLKLAKSHALYKLATVGRRESQKNLQAALGYLLFLRSYYVKKASQIEEPSAGSKTHVKLFTRLATIENNLGAVYELLQDENKAIQHYWKSIDYSRRISRENEVARYNLRLSFKRTGLDVKERTPVIMDFIPPRLKETL